MMINRQSPTRDRIRLNPDLFPNSVEEPAISQQIPENPPKVEENSDKLPLSERLPPRSRISSVSKARQTVDRDVTHMNSLRSVIPPPDYQSDWHTLDINELTPNKISTDKLLLLLTSVSSEINKASFDFQKYLNSNWSWAIADSDNDIEIDGKSVLSRELAREVHSLDKGITIEQVDDMVNKIDDALKQEFGYKQFSVNSESSRAERVIEDYIDSIESFGTSFDTHLDRLASGAFVRGAYFFEVVLNRRRPVGFWVADPNLIRFREYENPVFGQDWERGQVINGKFETLMYPTVFYEPVDSVIGSPYGRSLISPSIFPCIFLLGFMLDLRRVIRNQGYYKVDFSLDLEMLDKRIQQGMLSPAEVNAFVSQEIENIRQYYASLDPDDAYVHTSDITVNDVSGSLNTSGLSAVESIIMILQNQLTLACKTIPILMGINNSTSETHANRQWEDYMAAIRSCQRSLSRALGRAFSLVLQYTGIQEKCEFKFAELSVMTAMQYEQMRAVAISNIRNLLGEGGGGNNNVNPGEAGQPNPFGPGGGMPQGGNGVMTPLITVEDARRMVRELEELR